MLTLDPLKRITATKALDSDFFWTNPLPCEPKNMPKFPEPTHEYSVKKRQQNQVTRSEPPAAKRQRPEQAPVNNTTTYRPSHNPQPRANGTNYPSVPHNGNSSNRHLLPQPPRVYYSSGVTNAHPPRTTPAISNLAVTGRGTKPPPSLQFPPKLPTATAVAPPAAPTPLEVGNK
jgi:hypothetical protein